MVGIFPVTTTEGIRKAKKSQIRQKNNKLKFGTMQKKKEKKRDWHNNWHEDASLLTK